MMRGRHPWTKLARSQNFSRNPGPIQTRFKYPAENRDYLGRNWTSKKTENLGPISTNWTNESHLEKPAVEYYLNIIILKPFEVVILSFFMVFGDLLQNLSHRSIGLFLIVFVILIVFLII